MPSPRLLAVITTLCMIAGNTSAQQGPFTLSILRQIETLIVNKDCGGLRALLDANPALMVGNDPLARELRQFALGVDTGLIECFSAPTVIEPDVAVTLSQPY